MSKSCKVSKILTVTGLRVLANSRAPSCWGIRVPRIEVAAIIISSVRVSLTDFSTFHVGFDMFSVIRFSVINISIDLAGRPGGGVCHLPH
jgi:hypothetical protein